MAPPGEERPRGTRRRGDRASKDAPDGGDADASKERGAERPDRRARSRGGDGESAKPARDRSNRTTALFEKADRDGDGGISLQEVPRNTGYADRFTEFDKDRNGSLDLKEFTAMLSSGAGNRGNRRGSGAEKPENRSGDP